MVRNFASEGTFPATLLAEKSMKAAARQAKTTAFAKLAIKRIVLGATTHAAPTHTVAAAASGRVHFFLIGRKVDGNSAPPKPALRLKVRIAREGIWKFLITLARPGVMP